MIIGILIALGMFFIVFLVRLAFPKYDENTFSPQAKKILELLRNKKTEWLYEEGRVCTDVVLDKEHFRIEISPPCGTTKINWTSLPLNSPGDFERRAIAVEARKIRDSILEKRNKNKEVIEKNKIDNFLKHC